MAVRGLRVQEESAQAELAKWLGISQNAVFSRTGSLCRATVSNIEKHFLPNA
jgi:hypothetical protein